jgi:hypothetical protein
LFAIAVIDNDGEFHHVVAALRLLLGCFGDRRVVPRYFEQLADCGLTASASLRPEVFTSHAHVDAERPIRSATPYV